MNRFVEALKFEVPKVQSVKNKRGVTIETEENTDLIKKYTDFISDAYKKMITYRENISTTLRLADNEMNIMRHKSPSGSLDISKVLLKRQCTEAVYLATKSKELTSVINQYSRMAKYSVNDCVSFEGATQKLHTKAVKNVKTEYIIGENISGITVEIVNLGFDTRRSVKIIGRLVNEDLGVSNTSENSVVFDCDRMGTYELLVNPIATPKQQSRCELFIDIIDTNNIVLSSSEIKDIFFREAIV